MAAPQSAIGDVALPPLLQTLKFVAHFFASFADDATLTHVGYSGFISRLSYCRFR